MPDFQALGLIQTGTLIHVKNESVTGGIGLIRTSGCVGMFGKVYPAIVFLDTGIPGT